MAKITLQGNPINTAGELPAVGSQAPAFTLVKNDLSEASLSDYSGKNVILNIFPSLDTSTCATSVRKFNEELNKLDNTVVLCVSADLPFANGRFCTTEGLENVESLSVFRNQEFGKNYGLTFSDGPLKGLLSRAVVVLTPDGKVKYTQQVSEIVDEPDYSSAVAAVKA